MPSCSLELSDKTKTNYIYCGSGAISNFFISRGEESYSPETLALFVKTVQENFVNGAIQKASFQTMRKAAHWIEEYLSTGQVSQQKLRKYNFACAPPEFENLLSQYQLYMDNENYLKEGSRQLYLSSVRTFFRTIATLGIYRYAEITLPDVTRCLAKISETFPLGIFNLTGSMRSFARFMAEKHPELPDISPALVFSAAKRRRVYVGYTHEIAQKIFSAINRSSTMGMRDYAMIMLAYTTGLRGCDIVNLKFTVSTGMPANCVWYKRKQTSLYPYRLIQKLEMRLPITFSMPGPSANLKYTLFAGTAPLYKDWKYVDGDCKICTHCIGKGPEDEWAACFPARNGKTIAGSKYSCATNLRYSRTLVVCVLAPIYRVIPQRN